MALPSEVSFTPFSQMHPGLPDLVTTNWDSDDVSVLMGNGDGTFQDNIQFAAGSHPNAVSVADPNGDGLPDLVTANYGSSDVSVLLQQRNEQ